MTEFLTLLPPLKARAKLFEQLTFLPASEEIETTRGLNRVLVDPILAAHPLPSFPRSTVDGYALRAADTYGSSESIPAYLTIAGEVRMGTAPNFSLSAAHCALIYTGGMLPAGADAVMMMEHTQAVRDGEVEVLRSVAIGENVLQSGEDVSEGQQVFSAGTRLRPAEIGGLMALGVTRIRVARKPLVGIISSGDEVVPPESDLNPGQVRDINSYTLSALVEQTGGQPVRYGIVPDEIEIFRNAANRALTECDLIIITAGSSASTRDLTARVIDELGEPGVLVHGVNLRPGKPTILAACATQARVKAVIGLPGNPVSALVVARIFVVPVLERLLGLENLKPEPQVQARLSINLASQAGREDWVPVRILPSPTGFQADPVFGKSNLIFTLARADGFVRIPPDATGLSAGEQVEVLLL
ncbi:MAG: molybdopterin molybdenumtransferase MoeA [Chloroflexi bacterium RBG_16_54_18]|nr:MAG: molybdopterin molybdenumtransferase MoeA [Chloroflexi bacterium RBG_16_54_18]